MKAYTRKSTHQNRLANGRYETVVQRATANEVPSNATQYRLIVLELLLLQTEAMTRLDRLVHCHIATKPLWVENHKVGSSQENRHLASRCKSR